MIAIIDNGFASLLIENTKELVRELFDEIEDLSDPPKLAFIKYWERIIKAIHYYKNKCQTFAYVFIWPIIHIRTLHTVY